MNLFRQALILSIAVTTYLATATRERYQTKRAAITEHAAALRHSHGNFWEYVDFWIMTERTHIKETQRIFSPPLIFHRQYRLGIMWRSGLWQKLSHGSSFQLYHVETRLLRWFCILLDIPSTRGDGNIQILGNLWDSTRGITLMLACQHVIIFEALQQVLSLYKLQ